MRICVAIVLLASATAVPLGASARNAAAEASAAASGCVAINRIVFDPSGHAPAISREWIQLTNSCRGRIALDGWKVKNSVGRTYRLRDLAIPGGGLIRIYSGRGAQTPTYRYWREKDVWDDGGDRARLINASGRVVDSCGFTASAAGHVQCTTYAPPSTESDHASFRVECDFSHRKQVDPIVAPGPPGTKSAHMHDFFGNRSVDSDSTYRSTLEAGTSCGLSSDTAGYWVPPLMGPSGFVEPERMIIYYRSRPIDYGTTIPFPPDLRVVAGGEGSYPHAYWTCEGQSDNALETRAASPPDCEDRELKLHVSFPPCWDGLRNDSGDHRGHLAYAYDDDDGTSTDISDDLCPKTHPVKIPQVHIRVIFPVSHGPDYHLADHTTSPHADFWNTWKQAPLERLVRRCLRAGQSCDLQVD